MFSVGPDSIPQSGKPGQYVYATAARFFDQLRDSSGRRMLAD